AHAAIRAVRPHPAGLTDVGAQEAPVVFALPERLTRAEIPLDRFVTVFVLRAGARGVRRTRALRARAVVDGRRNGPTILVGVADREPSRHVEAVGRAPLEEAGAGGAALLAARALRGHTGLSQWEILNPDADPARAWIGEKGGDGVLDRRPLLLAAARCVEHGAGDVEHEIDVERRGHGRRRFA